MRRAKRVILALGALGEAAEAATHAQRTNAVTPAGQHLMRVTLMANVPNQPVIGRVEHIMQRRRQLDHAQARPQMAAGHANR